MFIYFIIYLESKVPKIPIIIHRWALFITIVRENLANRGDSSRIFVNSCPIRAAFGIFFTDS